VEINRIFSSFGERQKPFTLSLSFDFAQDIRKNAIVVSSSNHGLSKSGLCDLGRGEIMKE